MDENSMMILTSAVGLLFGITFAEGFRKMEE